MDESALSAPLTERGDPPLTLDEVREMHPLWKIERQRDGSLFCSYGPWRFPALDPEDAHRGIVARETPMTPEQIRERPGAGDQQGLSVADVPALPVR